MDDQNKNLILATALSFAVILVWFLLFPPPERAVDPNAPTAVATDGTPDVAAVPTTAGPTDPITGPTTGPTAVAEAEAPRLTIDTPRLSGSISLQGGRIDTLSLRDYRTTVAPDADIVQVLSPVGSPDAFYALYGWAPGGGLTADQVPGPNTTWSVEGNQRLSPETPVTLVWDNSSGLTFRREIAIDADYMFTIRQSVQNNTGAPATLAPYGILARHGEPQNLRKFFILHEGIIEMADGILTETGYSDVDPVGKFKDSEITTGGWIGFTDHYWMATLIPARGQPARVNAFYDASRDIYQTTLKLPTTTVAAGDSLTVTTQMFAGAKEWQTIRSYEAGRPLQGLADSFLYGIGMRKGSDTGVPQFIKAIDWGWFAFLTKPIFFALHELNILIGNMGWAIIGLTLMIKILVFPLAYKSYASMAKMKELQPEMEKLKERVGDDRQKLQKEMMELYKKEKVNPAAGCLPILLQIPIFFSLYKVIFVTLELRHAPFFGWLNDLSAPDSSSLFNLFGLLPWPAPEPTSILALIFIGVLPILLGISMWLQQKLNPAPTDPTQKMIFAWMPWVFMFMLGGFASGLVVYWIANNMITFTQQYLIMRSHGYTPDLFGNIRQSFVRGNKPDSK